MSGDRHTPAFGKGLKSFGKGFKIFCSKLALAKAIVALGRVGFGKGCSWSEVPQQDRGLQVSSAVGDKNALFISFCN